MIKRLSYILSRHVRRSIEYIQIHPQLTFILVLIFILPLIFLYSGQQFLEAGRDNQDRLQKDRIGLLHDAFVSVVRSASSTGRVQAELTAITSANPDLSKFRLIELTGPKAQVVAAKDDALIGTEVAEPEAYRRVALQLGDSLIFPIQTNDGRVWQTFHSFLDEESAYILFVELSLQQVDAVFAARERDAYFSLAFVYLVVMVLAYWHIRLTDYQHLYHQAAEANRMKDMFTNMVAHELRTPLTAIRGYASLIRESDSTTSDNQTHAHRIETASERLVAIVNDLLDVARLQSGKLSLQPTEVNVATLIQDTVAELTPVAAKKDLTLTHYVPTTTCTVTADQRRLQQVLINLISNSIKYTTTGTIEVYLEEKPHEVEVRVKDTGMGLSAEDREQLFAPFFRASGSEMQEITGTGLGMWITKQMVELMGGSIAVESIKDVGTHVVLHLPKS